MNVCPQRAWVLIHTTVAEQADAERIGTQLLQQGLAACVQYETIHSAYCWQGRLCREAEIRLSIKSAADLFARAAAAIAAMHPYECPEIVMSPLLAVHAPYAQWLQSVLADPETDAAEDADRA